MKRRGGILTTFFPLFIVGISVHVCAQETKIDSTFTGLDYYNSPLVGGVGAGIVQRVGAKYGTYRYFRTVPSLSAGVANAFDGFDMNVRYVYGHHQYKDSRGVGCICFPDDRVLSYSIRYRPSPALQLKYFRMDPNNLPKTQDYRGSYHNLSMVYLSKSGVISPAPRQLKWLHYADLYPNDVDQPSIPVLSKGQFQVQGYVSFSGTDRKYNDTGIKNHEYEKYTSPDYRYRMAFSYGIHESLLIGTRFNLQPSSGQELSSEDVSSTYVPFAYSLMTRHERQSWESESWLNVLWSDRFMHRFIVAFRNGEITQRYFDFPERSKSQDESQFEFREYVLRSTYVVTFLMNVAPPSMGVYLADWNGLFGNRLPKNGLLVRGMFFYHRHWGNSAYHSEGNTTVDYPDAQLNTAHAVHLDLQTRYGVFDWVEGCAALRYHRVWIGGVSHDPTKNHWSKQFSLQFGNYRYSRKYQEPYSWYHLSRFDRKYGSLLRSGMVKGRLGYEEYVFPDDRFGLLIPSLRILNLWFQAGVVNGVELRLGTDFSKEMASSDGGDNGWHGYLMTSLAWQPWKVLRVGITYSSQKRVDEGMSSLLGMPSWEVGLESLF